MKLGIRTKLFLLALGLISIALLTAGFYLWPSLDRFLSVTVRRDLHVRLDLVAHHARLVRAGLEDRARWDAFADELGEITAARVTVIQRDGVVLGDSQVASGRLASIENHARREEVVRAFAEGYGESTRISATIARRMLYAARPIEHDGEREVAVRVALPLTEVEELIGDTHELLLVAALIALAFATLAAVIATGIISRNVRAITTAAKNMAHGELSQRLRAVGHDELAELARALDQLAQNLSRSLTTLRKERDLRDGILAGMQEGVVCLDEEGRIALTNPAFREMFLLGSDITGRPLLEVVRHAELISLLEEARAKDGPVAGEVDIFGLFSRRLLVHACKSGHKRGLLLVLVDVTDIRRLETLRRDFVANASHELCTPVASARSALETYKTASATDPESAGEFLDIVERNIERLHQLIEDLLDLSRIESHGLKLDPRPLALEPIITATAGLFAERAKKKGIELVYERAGAIIAARAEKRAVEQVLTNLIDNAIKYCGQGSKVRIFAEADERFVRISVADTGPGIEPEHLARVFERFYRVDTGRSRELGGTGLGLAIVKHIVEASGGTVTLSSERGKGSVFSFSLPVAKS